MKLTQSSNLPGECVVVCAGPMTYRSHDFSEPLGRLVGAFGSRRILLDLAATTAIDSSGIRWLLLCRRAIHASGGELILCSAPPCVVTSLGLLNLLTQFVTAADLKQARGLALPQEAA